MINREKRGRKEGKERVEVRGERVGDEQKRGMRGKGREREMKRARDREREMNREG